MTKTAGGFPGIPGRIVKLAGGIVAGVVVTTSNEQDAPIAEAGGGVEITRMDKGAAGISRSRVNGCQAEAEVEKKYYYLTGATRDRGM